MSAVKIGVLALQGAFSEHVNVFNNIPGVTAVEVCSPHRVSHTLHFYIHLSYIINI